MDQTSGMHEKVKKKSYRFLVGKPPGNQPLKRSRRWEGNIKMHLRKIACGL
jgi:hypothetical protein